MAIRPDFLTRDHMPSPGGLARVLAKALDRVRGLVCSECNRFVLGALDHYGSKRRWRVILRLASYYQHELADVEPPPFNPDPNLTGYIEDGQHAA